MNDIAHNFHFFRKQIPSFTKIMAIIKAFGYGSGLKELSGYLQYLGCNYFAVAFTNEGVELREAGVNIPILVMNPEPETFPLLIQYNLIPSIFSFQQWKLFSRAVLDYGDRIPYPVHIKLDTGMNRLGFKPDEMEELLEIIKQDKYLFVEGIFSHLAASEDPEQDEFSLRQANVFVEMCREIEAQLDYRPIRHLLNSAGILRFPQFAMDMVRLGIGLHGFIGKSRHPQLKIPHRLTSRISQIKTVSKGESVGYGRMFRAERQHKIAILPIGYADGLRRQLSHGRWLVNVNGQYAPTVGWICMDMCMIDVSGIDCKEGDRVVIFSSENNLEKMSGICDTIPYELLTGLSHRIKRVFHEE
jgi:alanine racemase